MRHPSWCEKEEREGRRIEREEEEKEKKEKEKEKGGGNVVIETCVNSKNIPPHLKRSLPHLIEAV